MKLKIHTHTVVITLITMLFAAPCAHAEQARTTLRAEIQDALTKQQAANADGLDAAGLARRFYTQDVVIIGEGEKAPSRGIDAAIKAMQDWNDYLGPGGQKKCTFELEDPVIGTGDTASSFVVLGCKANPPKLAKDEIIRQLFVWKRTPQGWRVALEMWQAGGFGK